MDVDIDSTVSPSFLPGSGSNADFSELSPDARSPEDFPGDFVAKSQVSGNMAVDTDSSVSTSGSGYKPDMYALSSDARSPVGAPAGL
jgi:hypothetical protein